MTMYVLAAREESDLSSPVFKAGPDDREEAAAVFTTRAAAEKYISASGWEDSDVAAEVAPTPLLRWLLNLDAEGVEYIAVDPDRESHEGGSQQTMLNIRELTTELSEDLCERLQPTSH